MNFPIPCNPERRIPLRRDQPSQAHAALERGAPLNRAFTLIELLVVLAIIGLLAAVALPSMKGLQKSNIMVNATRQLIDDLARARSLAIRERTIVHVIFVPPTIPTMTPSLAGGRGGLLDRKQWTNLVAGAYTRYAIFAERSTGDQPGQPRRRYIGDWQQLPEGVTIAPWEFDDWMLGVNGNPALWDSTVESDRPFKFAEPIPFPTVAGTSQRVPHLAFDPTGALLVHNSSGNRVLQDEVISLARASVLVERDPQGAFVQIDVRELPPNNSRENYNRVRINGLTGRARVERPEIQ